MLSLYTITKYSVSSVLVRFQFTSVKDESMAVSMKLVYTTESNRSNLTDWNVKISFTDIIDATNNPLEFRDFGKPLVLYKIDRNFLVVIPKLNPNMFFYIKLKIEFDQNFMVIHEYTAATRAVMLSGK